MNLVAAHIVQEAQNIAYAAFIKRKSSNVPWAMERETLLHKTWAFQLYSAFTLRA
jgi:hypothetical protein